MVLTHVRVVNEDLKDNSPDNRLTVYRGDEYELILEAWGGEISFSHRTETATYADAVDVDKEFQDKHRTHPGSTFKKFILRPSRDLSQDEVDDEILVRVHSSFPGTISKTSDKVKVYLSIPRNPSEPTLDELEPSPVNYEILTDGLEGSGLHSDPFVCYVGKPLEIKLKAVTSNGAENHGVVKFLHGFSYDSGGILVKSDIPDVDGYDRSRGPVIVYTVTPRAVGSTYIIRARITARWDVKSSITGLPYTDMKSDIQLYFTVKEPVGDAETKPHSLFKKVNEAATDQTLETEDTTDAATRIEELQQELNDLTTKFLAIQKRIDDYIEDAVDPDTSSNLIEDTYEPEIVDDAINVSTGHGWLNSSEVFIDVKLDDVERYNSGFFVFQFDVSLPRGVEFVELMPDNTYFSDTPVNDGTYNETDIINGWTYRGSKSKTKQSVRVGGFASRTNSITKSGTLMRLKMRIDPSTMQDELVFDFTNVRLSGVDNYNMPVSPKNVRHVVPV